MNAHTSTESADAELAASFPHAALEALALRVDELSRLAVALREENRDLQGRFKTLQREQTRLERRLDAARSAVAAGRAALLALEERMP